MNESIPSGRGGDNPSAGQLQARLRLRERRGLPVGRQRKGKAKVEVEVKLRCAWGVSSDGLDVCLWRPGLSDADGVLLPWATPSIVYRFGCDAAE